MFEDAFRAFTKKVLKSDVQRLVVRRSNIWEDSLKQFMRGLSCDKTLKITFIGESALDAGGPRREFFTLLMRAIATNNMFFEGDLAQGKLNCFGRQGFLSHW